MKRSCFYFDKTRQRSSRMRTRHVAPPRCARWRSVKTMKAGGSKDHDETVVVSCHIPCIGFVTVMTAD